MSGKGARARFVELFSIDARALAAFRIGIGLVLYYDLFLRALILDALLTDQGLVPRTYFFEVYTSPHLWTVHAFSGELWIQTLLHFFHMLCAVALVVGYRTRLATFLCWFLFVSLNNRVPMVFHGADTALRMMLFFSIFLPLGARFSLDRRAGRTSALPSTSVFSVATAAVLIQVTSIYLCSAALKDHRAWAVDADAVLVAMRLDVFATRTGKALLHVPFILRGLSFATYYLELLGPLVAFVPFATARLRTIVVVAFVILHAGLWLCMELAWFPALMMVTWLLFLPPTFWDRLAAREPHAVAARRSRSWVGEQVVVGYLVACVSLWNVKATIAPSLELPAVVDAPLQWLHLVQWWGLFAPQPYTDDGWIVIAATLEDGHTIDLFRDGAPLTFEKPEHVAALYRHPRWRKYTRNLIGQPGSWHCERFVEVHAGWWRNRHPDASPIASVELFHMREDTRPDLTEAPPLKVLLWSTPVW